MYICGQTLFSENNRISLENFQCDRVPANLPICQTPLFDLELLGEYSQRQRS